MMRMNREQRRAKQESGLSCRQVAKDLQALLDDELHSSERSAQLEKHLELCRECGLEADTYRSIKSVLQNPFQPVDSTTLERLRTFGERLVRDGDPDA